MTIPPLGTMTFLFTDIEGSTRLWEDAPAAMGPAVAQHNALLTRQFTEHGGHVFKLVGDAVYAAFGAPHAALAAAVAAQQALRAAHWEGLPGLHVRMGLHAGAAEYRDRDYFGPPLNRTAHLMAVGHGGQILLSQTVYELVRDHVPSGITLLDLGAHRLKSLQRPEGIFQVCHPALPAAFPALRSLDNQPNNLPAPATTFIGREEELADLALSLANHRLMTLVGAGGAGKTRLALQAAAQELEGFRDGVWLVELAALHDPALVASRVVEAMKLRPDAQRPPQAMLAEELATQHTLLILDNCEHLLDGVAALADALLRACPGVRILATSREALRLPGEVLYRVPSLRLPPADAPLDIDTLTNYEAVRLFIDRALAVQPAFQVTNETAPALVQVCARLDGIPLAIELAASRLRALTLAQVATRLDDRFQLLTGGSRTALPRQQTLRALIDWSYDLLSPAERTVLCRLSVFAGGWTLEAAEAVAAGGEVAAPEVLDWLSQLVEKSLVTLESRPDGTARYDLLESIRQYAAARLAEAGEVEATYAAHHAYYRGQAARADLQASYGFLKPNLDQVPGYRRFCETETANIHRALQRVPADLDTNYPLARALYLVLSYRDDGLAAMRALLAGDDGAPSWARAEAWHFLARFATTTEESIACLTRGKEVLTALEAPVAVSTCLRLLVVRETGRRQLARAEALLGELLDCAARHPQSEIRYHAESAHMHLRFEQGRYDDAARLATACLAWTTCDPAIPAVHVSSLESFLAHMTYLCGDLATARAVALRAVERSRHCGIAKPINPLRILGDVARREGQEEAARHYYYEALSEDWEKNTADGLSNFLMRFGYLALAEGQPARAATLLAAAKQVILTFRAGDFPQHERAEFDQALATLQAALSPDAFADAWAAGERDDARALLLSCRPPSR